MAQSKSWIYPLIAWWFFIVFCMFTRGYEISGWWFQTWLLFSIIYGIIVPVDELIFFKMVKTTNQYMYILGSLDWRQELILSTTFSHFLQFRDNNWQFYAVLPCFCDDPRHINHIMFSENRCISKFRVSYLQKSHIIDDMGVPHLRKPSIYI